MSEEKRYIPFHDLQPGDIVEWGGSWDGTPKSRSRIIRRTGDREYLVENLESLPGDRFGRYCQGRP